MADAVPEHSIEDMASLARRIRAEAVVMRRQTQRQARAYVAVAILLAAYLSWAFLHIARFIDVDRLASNAGVLTTGKVLDLLNKAQDEARRSLPDTVRKTELHLVASVPETASDLTVLLRDKPGAALQVAFAPYDQAFLEEAGKLPNAGRRLAEAAASPAAADRLTAQLLPRIAARGEVVSSGAQAPADLLLVLHHVRALETNRHLMLGERVERQLLQDALAPAQ